MDIQRLRTGKEKSLFAISLVVSLLAWIVVVVTVIGIFYALFFGMFMLIAHVLMIAHIKGHGVRLSEKQLPEIYARVIAASEKLGLKATPEVYVMQAGGALNAFATKLTSRNFIVIYSDLLEACGDEGKEIDMIIGHEIGHLALGHLKWLWVLLPSRIVPLLGAAYSRACEYSCDRCGFEVTGEIQSAARGLTILAAGGKYGKILDMQSFVLQVKETGGFWASVYELNATHPYLSKRVAALLNSQRPGLIPIAGRNALAYPLAPFFGIASTGGSAPLIMVAVVGMMVAIAIPQFNEYRTRADMAMVDTALTEIRENAIDYRERNNRWPCSEADLTMSKVSALVAQKNWNLELNCQNGFALIGFKKQGTEHRKAINFQTGQIEELPD